MTICRDMPMFRSNFVLASSGQEMEAAGSSRVLLSTKLCRLLENTKTPFHSREELRCHDFIAIFRKHSSQRFFESIE
jgi:hypothetical protein